MLMNNLTVSSTKSFAAAISLRLGWTVPGDLFQGAKPISLTPQFISPSNVTVGLR
jgi:hypothetical protein